MSYTNTQRLTATTNLLTFNKIYMKLKPNQFIETKNETHLKKLHEDNNENLYVSFESDLKCFKNWNIYFKSDENGDCFVTLYSNVSLIGDWYTEVFEPTDIKKEYTIKKWDEFLCTRDFVMNDKSIAFIKWKRYKSENGGRLTNERSNNKHNMSKVDYFFEYFERVNSSVFKNKYYIGEKVWYKVDWWSLLQWEIQAVIKFQYEIWEDKNTIFLDEKQLYKTKSQLIKALLKEEEKRHNEEIERINKL